MIKKPHLFFINCIRAMARKSSNFFWILLATLTDYGIFYLKLTLTQKKIAGLSEQEKEIIKKLKKDGIVVLPNFFSSAECLEIRNEIDLLLEKFPQYINPRHSADQRIYGIENLSVLIRKKFSHNPFFQSLASAFNQLASRTAFTLGAKMIFKGKNLGSGEGWHRDAFFKQFKTIVYLTDAKSENGPFQYLKKSQKLPNIFRDIRTAKLKYIQYRIEQSQIDEILKKDPQRLVTVTGNAGSVIIVDTSLIHRGKPIESGERYALTNYFYPENQINDELFEHFSPGVFTSLRQ